MDAQFKNLTREILSGNTKTEKEYDIEQLNIEDEFKEVWDYALSRFRFGAIEYGEWIPEEDDRDIIEDIKEELGDVAIYAGMLLIKLNRLQDKLRKLGLR